MERPDILLAHAYFLAQDPVEQQVMKPYPPLGILYISAFLKKQGLTVEIFDGTFREMEEFVELVSGTRPRVVGIYCNMMTRRWAIKMIRHCRQAGSKVVAGGPDPPNYTREYLDHGVDVVVLGEGEHTLVDLIPILSEDGDLGGVDGIAYLSDGEVRQSPPRAGIASLDQLPFPDRESIDIRRYLDTWRAHHGYGPMSLITARGCPYKCSWCSHAVYGFSHRRRSVDNVVAEIEHVSGEFGPDALWYADDVFTMNRRWLEELSKSLAARGIRLGFETITREDRLDENTASLLAGMNCKRIWIGAESGSQSILDGMQRRTDTERVIEMVHLLQGKGIQVGLFIMLGYENETVGDIRKTIEFLKRAKPDTYLTTVAYPIKGTAYYDLVADRVIRRLPWASSSDRDLEIVGRPSRLYYANVTRWIRGEVDCYLEKRSRGRHGQVIKAYGKAKLGRLGMAVTNRGRI